MMPFPSQPPVQWVQPTRPTPQAWQQPSPPQPARPAMPVLADLAAGSQPGNNRALPPAKVRGLNPMPTQPRPLATPTRLALPSPEELGIRPATPNVAVASVAPTVDWNQTHARLERLRAVRFQSDRLPQGGYRIMFLLPMGTTQTTFPIEALAATEAGAVQLALQQAEAWTSRQQP